MKAVLFDLDDTLYDEKEFVRSGFRAVTEYLARRTSRKPQTIQARLDEILQQQGRGKVFNTLLKEFDLNREVNVLLLLFVYRSHMPAIRLDEQCLPCFEFLRRAGCKLGIVTDGMASVQRRKIDTLALEKHVDVVLCTDELGAEHWKPSTIPFNVALELLEVPAAEAVYVGDNPDKDFIGPNRLGMTTVQLTKYCGPDAPAASSEEARARFRVRQLSELVDIVAGRPE